MMMMTSLVYFLFVKFIDSSDMQAEKFVKWGNSREIQRRKHEELDTISKRLARLFFQLEPKDTIIAIYDGDFDGFTEHLSGRRFCNHDERHLADFENILLEEKEFERISAKILDNISKRLVKLEETTATTNTKFFNDNHYDEIQELIKILQHISPKIALLVFPFFLQPHPAKLHPDQENCNLKSPE